MNEWNQEFTCPVCSKQMSVVFKAKYRNRCKLCHRRLNLQYQRLKRYKSKAESGFSESLEARKKDRLRKKSVEPSLRRCRDVWYKLMKEHPDCIPVWSDFSELLLIYAEAGDNRVKHIVPINGKDVCGLHVPANLTYRNLTKSLGNDG